MRVYAKREGVTFYAPFWWPFVATTLSPECVVVNRKYWDSAATAMPCRNYQPFKPTTKWPNLREQLFAHELVHAKKHAPKYGWKWIPAYLFAFVRAGFRHDMVPFEIEARIAAGEQ